jgi:hypothetical protein
MKQCMLTMPGCKVQQLFFCCMWIWLAHLDIISPDISHITMEQRPLVEIALGGWDYWALAIAAHPSLKTHDQCTTQH